VPSFFLHQELCRRGNPCFERNFIGWTKCSPFMGTHSVKQTGNISSDPCNSKLVWHQSLIQILFNDRAFVHRLNKIQPRVVTLLPVDIMVMPRVVMKIMVTLLLLLDRIPMCMEVIRGILVTNTHSSNNSKWDIVKNLPLQICDLCDSTVLMELLFPSRNKDSYPFSPSSPFDC